MVQHSAINKQKKLQHNVNQLRFMLSTEQLQLMPEFHMRLDVLQRLNYIDSSKAVLLKGRVAREV
jgi:antiviral helicase SKI2